MYGSTNEIVRGQAFAYEQTTIPPGMTVKTYRRERAERERRTRRSMWARMRGGEPARK